MWQVEKAMKTAKKTKEKQFGKQNRKEEEACSKEDETRVNKEDGKNTDEKIKESTWLLTTK